MRRLAVAVCAGVVLVSGCARLDGPEPSPSASEVFDDVVALEPPRGYEFLGVSESEPVRDWEVRRGHLVVHELDHDPGEGEMMIIQSGVESRDPAHPGPEGMAEFCAGLVQSVAAEEGVSRVEQLPERLIDDAQACGVAWQQGEGDTAQVVMRWDLCRRDGCWRFIIKGAQGRDHVRGDFRKSLRTVRFVPRPVVGEDAVVNTPEASPTATKS